MLTHVIHFLRHSGTATSRHSRPGHCGPFVYPGKRRPVGEAPGAGPRFALPPAALQGAKPPAHPDTRSAWQTVRRTALSMSPSRVLCLWAFCSPGFPGVSSAAPPGLLLPRRARLAVGSPQSRALRTLAGCYSWPGGTRGVPSRPPAWV